MAVSIYSVFFTLQSADVASLEEKIQELISQDLEVSRDIDSLMFKQWQVTHHQFHTFGTRSCRTL